MLAIADHGEHAGRPLAGRQGPVALRRLHARAAAAPLPARRPRRAGWWTASPASATSRRRSASWPACRTPPGRPRDESYAGGGLAEPGVLPDVQGVSLRGRAGRARRRPAPQVLIETEWRWVPGPAAEDAAHRPSGASPSTPAGPTASCTTCATTRTSSSTAGTIRRCGRAAGADRAAAARGAADGGPPAAAAGGELRAEVQEQSVRVSLAADASALARGPWCCGPPRRTVCRGPVGTGCPGRTFVRGHYPRWGPPPRGPRRRAPPRQRSPAQGEALLAAGSGARLRGRSPPREDR